MFVFKSYFLFKLLHHWLFVIVWLLLLLLNLLHWDLRLLLLHLSSNLGSLPVRYLWHSLYLALDIKSVLIWTENQACPIWNVEPELIWPSAALLLDGLEPSVVGVVDSLVATESVFVGFIQDEMITLPEGSNMIVLEGLTLIEVENEKEFSLFVNDHFIFLVCLSHELVLRDH